MYNYYYFQSINILHIHLHHLSEHARLNNGYLKRVCSQLVKKLNLEYKNYKILGACNPRLAHKALESESFIGILMPCNILLIDNENQSTKIVFPYAKNLLEVTENNSISDLTDKVDDLLKSAFDNIK